tara:strand:+ start:107180 stop:107368 length:189 start_codon:yes stop_codon:yes gene_type:complete
MENKPTRLTFDNPITGVTFFSINDDGSRTYVTTYNDGRKQEVHRTKPDPEYVKSKAGWSNYV